MTKLGSAASRGTRLTTSKYVYDFSEGSGEMRDLLGGKGAGIAEMARIGPPVRVPAGFTITTEACVAYMNGAGELPEGLDGQVAAAVARVEEQAGKRLGDPADPLLVSVRSGARESMPGMMDTVLNLGLNDQSVEGLIAKASNERFSWDSYRRFLQMFGNVVREIPAERYEDAILARKQARGVRLDTELTADDMEELANEFKRIFREETGEGFPQDPREQLRQAIRAVFGSWNGARAFEYRRLNQIPDDWERRSTCNKWSLGTRATGPRRASPSAATRRPEHLSRRVTSWRTPRARMSSRACATPVTSLNSRT